jgi:hypothetical protein
MKVHIVRKGKIQLVLQEYHKLFDLTLGEGLELFGKYTVMPIDYEIAFDVLDK